MTVAPPPVQLAHLTAWLSPITRLAGDRRTATLLRGTVAGILGSGSLVCTRMAAFSPSAGHVAAWRPPDPAHADR
jgi:hypothetical protein